MARYQFSLRSLLVFTTLFVAIFGGALRIGRHYSEAAKRHDTRNNFRMIWLALAKYNERQGLLPPACARDASGRALSSWRFLIVGDIESKKTESDETAPWDDPVNRDWARRMPLVYCFTSAKGPLDSRCITNMLAVTGPGTAFDSEHRCALPDLDPDAILLVETTTSRLHWMQPGDIDLNELPTVGDCGSAGISGSCRGGFFVGFADGEIWLLSDKTPLVTLRKFFTVKRSNSDSREELLASYRLPLE